MKFQNPIYEGPMPEDVKKRMEPVYTHHKTETSRPNKINTSVSHDKTETINPSHSL